MTMPHAPLPLRTWLTGFAAALLCFLALDACWISLSLDRLYRPMLGGLLAPQPQWLPVLLFYPLYLASLLAFAIAPALRAGRVAEALWRGALLGAAAYGTYDFTNQATLRDWPWLVTLADLTWGTFATSTTAALVSAWLIRRTSKQKAYPHASH